MKERPILFSAPMVRALLDGSKTQTRRIMKPQPEPTPADYPGPTGHWWPSNNVQSMVHVEQELQNQHGSWGGFCADCCPHGRIGDRLWVRETVADIGARLTYRADTDDGAHCMVKRWTPSIHMPRWASRILLEIVSVRVERLQDISEADCWAEGIDAVDGSLGDMKIIDLARRMNRCFEDAAPTYAALWEQINGAGSWDANPWVWVVEFKRVTL